MSTADCAGAREEIASASGAANDKGSTRKAKFIRVIQYVSGAESTRYQYKQSPAFALHGDRFGGGE